MLVVQTFIVKLSSNWIWGVWLLTQQQASSHNDNTLFYHWHTHTSLTPAAATSAHSSPMWLFNSCCEISQQLTNILVIYTLFYIVFNEPLCCRLCISTTSFFNNLSGWGTRFMCFNTIFCQIQKCNGTDKLCIQVFIKSLFVCNYITIFTTLTWFSHLNWKKMCSFDCLRFAYYSNYQNLKTAKILLKWGSME